MRKCQTAAGYVFRTFDFSMPFLKHWKVLQREPSVNPSKDGALAYSPFERRWGSLESTLTRDLPCILSPKPESRLVSSRGAVILES